ncbi:sodium/myo-inositol cotransporter 2 isoform X3 [Heterodontus francisci]|uniref:sodium/myo-inositol cotransporter 2 isoform X3 n=1 Tax=Heterodontus francisci TaxID=7792 RepID=UPI00355B111E
MEMKTKIPLAMEQTTNTPASTVDPAQTPRAQQILDVADIVVLVIYLLFVLAVGLWSMHRTKRNTVKGYFLAGKNMVWWPIGASLFASNVGSGHFIGLAGTGAASGIAVSAYEFNGMIILILLAWFFLPIYIAAEVDIYAGAVFIQQALHWNLYIAVIGLLAITTLYTVGGGLAAVIYTDALQTVIMLIGALILMGYAFVKVEGYSGLQEMYFHAIPSVRDLNTTCGLPRKDAFHIFRDPVTSDFPWPGVLIGMTIPSIWYWCTDQVIVQRSLSAKTLLHAKGGSLFAVYLKILPVFIMVLPGMISRVLFVDEVACADADTCRRICGNAVGCSDIAYPKLVMELLPGGLRGLMMSVMIAALMSSLTSIFNSASTIFTMDVWHHIRPHCPEWELMIVGRVFVLVLVALSVLWIPLVQMSQGGQLFMYIQSISSYLQPPVAVVFIAGCFWKRTNEMGAFWGLFTGILAGCIRMALDFIYPEPLCGHPDNRPLVTKYVHYLHFSIILSVFTLIVVVVISLSTKPPDPEKIRRLTWYTHFERVDTVAGPPKEAAHKMNSTMRQPEGDKLPREEIGNTNNISLSTDQPEGGELHLEEVSNKSNASLSVAESVKERSKLISFLLWFCGMNQKEEAENTPPSEILANTDLLSEEPCMRNFINANLIVCLTATVFLYAYFF